MKTFQFIVLFVALLLVSVSFASAQKQDAKSTKFCTTCELVVGYIEQYINKTEPAIINELNHVCATVMPGPLKLPCQLLVSEYGKNLIDAVLKAETPEVVCSQLRFCDAKQAPKQDEEKKTKDSSTICTTCKTVVAYAEDYMNRSRPEIVKELVIACGKLPFKYQQLCDTLVVNYADVLIDYLLDNEDPDTFCTQVGLCSSKAAVIINIHPKSKNPKGNSLECPLCKLLVGGVEKYIGNDKTVTKIKKGLDYVCAHLPSSFTKQCEQIVEQYTDVLIEFIKEDYPAEKVCQILRLCDAKKSTAVVEKKTEALPVCPLCMFAIQEVQNVISKEATVKVIEKELEKVCEFKIVSKYSGQCKAMIEQFTPAILAAIQQYASPSKVCALLKACGNDLSRFPKLALKKQPEQSSQYCAICIEVASFVENYIKQNKTEERIIEALQKVCDYVPSSYQKECKLLISFGFDSLLQKLLDSIPPKKLCQEIGICSAQLRISSKDYCNVCKDTIAIVDNFITKNSTEERIIEVVEKVCQFLPSGYQLICDTIIKQNGKEIIEQLIAKVLSPSAVCGKIKLCPNVEKSIYELHKNPIAIN